MDGLSSICAGLGLLDEDDDGNRIGYVKGEYCSDNLKDLLRFLRRDDPEKRDVFKQVCKWNILGKDLIPIIEYCQEDRTLVLNAVKVLVFLTMPIEPTSFDIPQQIEYLWGLKSAICYSDIVPVIMSLLESPLENLENESFTEEDWKLVQLVLTLFRNILAIQDISIQQKAGGSATQFLSLRDRCLELLFKENVMDLILVLSQHTGGSHGYLRQDNLLLLEIFFYIFNGQEPELIAKASLRDSKVEDATEDSVASLQSIMKDEREKRTLKRFHNFSRHSQFRGIFTRVTTDGSKALLLGNPSTSGDALLKAHKNNRGPSKREAWDNGKLPSTKTQTLQLLDDFTSQFLRGGYNVLMQSILEDIEKEHQEIQSNDIVTFFQVAQFATSFQYHKCLGSKPSNDLENETLAASQDDNTLFRGSICGPVAATLNEAMFQMLIAKWRYAFEGLKQTNDYKFLSAAGSLLKIMIRMLDLVLKQSSEDSKDPQTVRILLYKIFYDQTEEGMTQFLLNQIKSFDVHKQSKSDLANLVESMHVILRLLENLQTRGRLRVSKKTRKNKTKKVMPTKGKICEPTADGAIPQKEVDDSIFTETSTDNMLEKETSTHQDLEIEGDKSTRNSVEIDDPVLKPANVGNNESEVEERNIVDNDGYLETDNSSGDEQLALRKEVDFNSSSLVFAIANSSIIQKLCWLLKFYKSNSASTNHYIITMLRRICEDLELSPMLYQLSHLTIFYDILEEQKLRPRKEYENVVTFLTSLVRRMLRKMKSYPLLFVEVLYSKTRRECHYVNCGSMLKELNNLKNEFGGGMSDAKDGENGLCKEQTWVRRSLADALGDDDFVASGEDTQEGFSPFEENFQQPSQSSGKANETSVSAQNRNDGSEVSYREEHSGGERIRSPGKGNHPVLSNEMKDRLKHLYEKYKDNPKCCRLIAGELDPDRGISKVQVSNILTQLGFKVPEKGKVLKDMKIEHSRSSTDPSLTTAGESQSVRQPMNSRKRVHAFSLDEEQKIKELYEQFKDQKKCSSLIANALDSTGQISAARVSRKLKQLGLVIPKKKSSHANTHLGDEIDISSDDETLLSRRKRAKQKRDESRYEEDQNNKIARKLPEDFSDDELLSSLVVKTKKKQLKAKEEELMTDSFDKTSVEINSIGLDDNQFSERGEFAEGIETGVSDADRATTVVGNLNESSMETEPIENDGNSQHLHLDDELADFDEDAEAIAAAATQEKRWSNRRRMVIDDDDDDD